MHITLWLDGRRSGRETLALASQAEQAGWDGVRYGDGLGERADRPETWAVLGALAAAVPRIRLEAVVQDDLGRHPAVVAKLATTVDQLSAGRVLLGLAPSSGGDTRLAETVEVIKNLAQHERTTFNGRFYQLQGAPLDPKPMQQPFHLMLVGGPADLAAKYADHWSITGDIEAQLTALKRACDQINRDQTEITVSATWTDQPPQPGIDEWVVPENLLPGDDLRDIRTRSL